MKEELPNGHETIVTEHFDGSRDVQINIKRLDLGKERTEEDIAAEDVILSNLQKIQVGVVVLCKATGDSAYFVSSLTEVRGRAQAVINSYLKDLDILKIKQIEYYCRGMNCLTEQAFAIIEVAVGERPPKISTL